METLFDSKRYLEGNQIPKFRAIVLGNSNVGKTSLIMRYMNHHFREEYFPTKDIVIFKNLVNFNPSSEDENEYAYLEILDTVAYDRGKTITDFAGFFSLISRNDVQITSLNQKLGKIGETIKYEHILKKKQKNIPNNNNNNVKLEEFKYESSKRRLFSFSNLMAYVFVYDYNDEKSLDDVHTLCRNIIENENSKNDKRTEYNTVKVFIANKYPFLLDDDNEEKDEKTKKIIYPIFNRDSRAFDILQKLKIHYGKDEGLAKSNLFFVNAKSNVGLDDAFVSVFKKIFQKEELWKIKDYDSNNEESDNEKEEKPSGIISQIFCCSGRDKPNKKQKQKLEEEIIIEDKLDKAFYKAQVTEDDNTNQMKNPFKIEDEDDYDMNYIIKPLDKNLEAEAEIGEVDNKVKTSSESCIIL